MAIKIEALNKDPNRHFYTGIRADEQKFRDYNYVVVGVSSRMRGKVSDKDFSVDIETLDDFCAQWLKARGLIEDA